MTASGSGQRRMSPLVVFLMGTSAAVLGCSSTRIFATPEDTVRAYASAVRRGELADASSLVQAGFTGEQLESLGPMGISEGAPAFVATAWTKRSGEAHIWASHDASGLKLGGDWTTLFNLRSPEDAMRTLDLTIRHHSTPGLIAMAPAEAIARLGAPSGRAWESFWSEPPFSTFARAWRHEETHSVAWMQRSAERAEAVWQGYAIQFVREGSDWKLADIFERGRLYGGEPGDG